jgi:peptidoglycan hydrolase CwlO-like protein
MFDKRIVSLSNEDRKIIEELRRLLMAFADSIAKLQADVTALINAEGSITAALAAKDAADAAAVNAIDTQVVAALPPAPAPAAPVAPTVPATPAA